MKKYKVRFTYNRKHNENEFFTGSIEVIAHNYDNAVDMVDNYEVEGLFDLVEDDYIEDSLYVIIERIPTT